MQTTIEKTFRVDAPLEEAWAFLSDPSRVVTCVPGASITEQVDDRHYKGAVSMKVGPVTTDFQGTIEIERLDAENHEIELSGTGQDAKGKGSATMKMTGRLRALDEGGTEVASSMQVGIVGKLAQFGQRLFSDISNRMFEQFVACFADSLAAAVPAPEPATAQEAPGDRSGPAVATAAPPPRTRAQQRASEPVKALPLLLGALRDAFARLVRRLSGKPVDS